MWIMIIHWFKESQIILPSSVGLYQGVLTIYMKRKKNVKYTDFFGKTRKFRKVVDLPSLQHPRNEQLRQYCFLIEIFKRSC